MVKLHHFHQTVQEYYERGKDNLFPDIIGCPYPNCHFQGRLRRHGFYSRNVLTFRSFLLIFIQRYYCPSCKHTVSLLPTFLMPHFQYSLACIFFSLFRTFTNHLPLARIAQTINQLAGRVEMSHQHLVFYKKRFLMNLPLMISFLSSNEIVFANISSQSVIQNIFQRCVLEVFHFQYFQFQTRHFLGKS